MEEILNIPLVKLSSGGQITVGKMLAVAIFLVLAVFVGRVLMRLLAQSLTRRKVDPNVSQVVSMIFFWGLLVLIIMTVLGMLSVPIAHLAFLTGAVAVGVGFGSQNIINNLISGWILMSEKPVRIGDVVELDQHRGTVEGIGNRSTRIRRIDGVHLLVPNSQILERVVINWTLRDRRFRLFIRLGVAYGSPVDRTAQLIRNAADSHELVLQDPHPNVVFEDFGDNALIFELYFWCEVAATTELRIIRSEIRFAIEKLLRENDIVIAFPQRDVHLDSSSPIDIRLISEAGK